MPESNVQPGHTKWHYRRNRATLGMCVAGIVPYFMLNNVAFLLVSKAQVNLRPAPLPYPLSIWRVEGDWNRLLPNIFQRNGGHARRLHRPVQLHAELHPGGPRHEHQLPDGARQRPGQVDGPARQQDQAGRQVPERVRRYNIHCPAFFKIKEGQWLVRTFLFHIPDSSILTNVCSHNCTAQK